MNKTLKKALVSFVAPAMATLFVTAASWSMPPGDKDRHDPQQRVAHMAEELKLTEEQIATVQTLIVTSSEQIREEREQVRALREQLMDQPATFDAITAQATADEIGEITGRMAFSMASTRAEIYQLLDDEQKLLMDEMKGKRGDKRRGDHP